MGDTDTNGVVDEESVPSTGRMALTRVQLYFQHLREALQVQETAALSAIDTHIRERIGSIKCLQEVLGSSLAQVGLICLQCEQILRQDDFRVITAGEKITEGLDVIEKHKQTFAELSPEQLQPDVSIPITFTKVIIWQFIFLFENLVYYFIFNRITECILVQKWKSV